MGLAHDVWNTILWATLRAHVARVAASLRFADPRHTFGHQAAVAKRMSCNRKTAVNAWAAVDAAGAHAAMASVTRVAAFPCSHGEAHAALATLGRLVVRCLSRGWAAAKQAWKQRATESLFNGATAAHKWAKAGAVEPGGRHPVSSYCGPRRSHGCSFQSLGKRLEGQRLRVGGGGLGGNADLLAAPPQ